MNEMKAILLADDNEELRDTTREMLEILGYTVLAADGGLAAARLHRERREEIFLLITDVAMPDLNGFELADLLLARDEDLAVIFISGHVREISSRRAASALLLPKPFSSDELAAAIRHALEPKNGGASSALEKPVGTPASAPRPIVPAKTRGPFSRAPRTMVAIASLLVLSAMALIWRGGPPPLPAPAETAVRRSTTIEPIYPLGTVERLPRELHWQTVARASSYRVSLRGVDGVTLWHDRVVRSPVTLPAEFRQSLHPLVVYFWMVEAFDEEERLLARTTPVRFTVRPSAP